MIHLELRHLRYFVAIADAGTMAAAAKLTFVTQSTLSHQLAQLERELNSALFERIGRTLRLTDAGNELLGHARMLLLQAEETRRAVSRVESMERGLLRIGVIHSFTVGLIPPVAAGYMKRWPGVRLKILEATASEIESQVAEGKLDLGVAFYPPSNRDVLGERLFEERLMLAVPSTHALARHRSVKFSQVGSLPMAMLSSRFATRRLLDTYFQRAGVRADVAVEIDSVDALRRIVEQGAAVAFLPELITSRSRRIRFLRVTDPQPTRAAGLIWRQSKYRSTAVIQFATQVFEQCGKLTTG